MQMVTKFTKFKLQNQFYFNLISLNLIMIKLQASLSKLIENIAVCKTLMPPFPNI